MGGVLGTLLTFQNNRTMVEHPDFKKRAAYGAVNIQVTTDEADRSGIYRMANVSEEEHEVCYNQWYHQTNALQRVAKQCEVSATRHAIAYRTIAKVVREDRVDEKGRTRAFEFTHLNDPSYLTYGELWDYIVSFGKGLAELGLTKGAKVAIYEDTRWEWITSMFGLWTQEMVGVTVYANLGHDALIFALREAECTAIICNGKNAGKLTRLLTEGHVKENIIIYTDELAEDVDPSQHRLLRWAEVVQMGRSSNKPYSVVNNNDFEGLIMYTSGTTGNPKGVVHSLGSVTQGARGLNDRLTELLGTTEGETYVAFLPSAHIFEFVCEIIMLMRGTLLCYGSPRTLMDAFARPHGDMTQFKPFFIIGVPRIFETIKKTAESRMPPPGSLKRQIFERAYESRLAALKEGMDTPFWNSKVFALPRSLLGPNIRGVCSGGAPLANKTQEWVNVVLGVPIAQGYGMTETVCNTTVQRTGELDCVAGQLLRGVEARLLDTDTYKHTDSPNPRGELLVRGKFMFKGYYKQEKMTAECMLPDGWLRTGDVAEIEKGSGQVRIIGRVKALAKNVLGEYIALENLEAIYNQHPLATPNGICVLVDPQKSYICALVTTSEANTMKFAHEHKLEGEYPAILETEAFRKAASHSFAALGKKDGLQSFEVLKYVRVLADEWTPENDLVTASLKVRRSQIDKHYAKVIAELFSE